MTTVKQTVHTAHTTNTILVLGGTADARHLTTDLLTLMRSQRIGSRVIYSLAGLVRKTPLDCEVISGGFSQFGGIASYLQANQIDLIVNATHPYAMQISAHATTASQTLGIPAWRLMRRPWQAVEGDKWQRFADTDTLLNALADKSSVLISVGQLSQSQIDLFSQYKRQKQCLRTAVSPNLTLPDSMRWRQAIGPFTLEAELDLLKQYKIDAIVSKNSGGQSTYAKIVAARQLGVPVYFVERPQIDLTAYQQVFDSNVACLSAIKDFTQTSQLTG